MPFFNAPIVGRIRKYWNMSARACLLGNLNRGMPRVKNKVFLGAFRFSMHEFLKKLEGLKSQKHSVQPLSIVAWLKSGTVKKTKYRQPPKKYRHFAKPPKKYRQIKEYRQPPKKVVPSYCDTVKKYRDESA
ncbi:unnamed protein product, partial [Pylaiella littoralis]